MPERPASPATCSILTYPSGSCVSINTLVDDEHEQGHTLSRQSYTLHERHSLSPRRKMSSGEASVAGPSKQAHVVPEYTQHVAPEYTQPDHHALAPQHSHFVDTLHRVLSPEPKVFVDDGFDNYPPPTSAVDLPRTRSRSRSRSIMQGVREDEEEREEMEKQRDMVRQMDVPDVGPAPEGGLEAWLCVAGAWLILFTQFGMVTSFGQFESYYLDNQLSSYPKQTVSWIGSLQTFFTFVGSLPAGRYFDAHGARHLMIFGTSLSIVSLICLAFCKEFYQFLLAHLLFGISGSILYSPATAVAGHWFMKRRSTAVGIIVCGSGLGGVIYPIALGRMFEHLTFRNTVLIIAGMNAVLVAPSWVVVKARLPPRHPMPWKGLWVTLREARFLCFVLGVCLVWMNFFTPYFFANSFSLVNGVAPNVAIYSVGLVNAGSFFGRGMSGFLADKLGVWRLFIGGGIGSAITLFALWTKPDIGTVGTIFGLVIFGATSGAFITLVAATCASISPVKEFGGRLGLTWSMSAFPILCGPQVSAVLINAEGGTFTHAAVFSGVTFIVGTALTCAPRTVRLIREFFQKDESDNMNEKV